MKIGYACLNRTVRCTPASTFRLRSYSRERLIETVSGNLECLQRILEFNAEHGILFLRLSSDLVPFASHPVLDFDWQSHFQGEFTRLGEFIRRFGMRISMHPDQFTLINSKDENIFERSARELLYHARVLDQLGLDHTAKIQIHAGGVYGDKETSMHRFAMRYSILDQAVRDRLVVENDDRHYTMEDCLRLSSETGIPVLLDTLHHIINPSDGSLRNAVERISAAWKERDGLPMIDYSAQMPGRRPGKHIESIDTDDFRSFLGLTKPFDFDIMIEIKDKEESALRAIAAASGDPRLIAGTGSTKMSHSPEVR
ncbi:MAG: UV DNA damage repair endonuclease UvsE [Candidatus Latescibacterota bacterium]